MVAEPVVSNTNSKNRRGHNTAERINCISKVLHVLEPPSRRTRQPIVPDQVAERALRQPAAQGDANRKVIDHVRKTRGHLLRSKAVGEDQAQRPLSARCLWRDLKRKLRVSWRAPFLIVWRLPKQRKDFRDRHHVLELFREPRHQHLSPGLSKRLSCVDPKRVPAWGLFFPFVVSW